MKRIVTHANCPDGLASAMILKWAYPQAEVVLAEYRRPSQTELEPLPGTIFCDMSPAASNLEAHFLAGAVVLDHHASQAEVVRRFEALGNGSEYAEDKCGALLAAGHVMGMHVGGARRASVAKEMLRFAHLADVRDRWLKSSPDWLAACEQAAALMFFPVEHWLAAGRPPHLTGEEAFVGRIATAKRAGRAKEVAERALNFTAGGIKVAMFADSEGIVSDAADACADLGAELVVAFRISDGPRVDYSLRSRPGARMPFGFDCASFAKARGGGGHRNAAGLKATTSDPVGWIMKELETLVGAVVEHDGPRRPS